jgi:hypothetical protein
VGRASDSRIRPRGSQVHYLVLGGDLAQTLTGAARPGFLACRRVREVRRKAALAKVQFPANRQTIRSRLRRSRRSLSHERSPISQSRTPAFRQAAELAQNALGLT